LNKPTLATGQIITRRVAKVIDCRPIAGRSPAPHRQSINFLLCGLCDSAVKKTKVEVDYKPSSVPLPRSRCRKAKAMIIHLRIGIAPGLKRPTRGSGAGHPFRPPIWSCSGWGLPGYPGHPEYRWALTPPFHPYPFQMRNADCRFRSKIFSDSTPHSSPVTHHLRKGGIFSVALSFSSPRLGVTQHPALWSSDFPPVIPEVWRAII
jgi:hypothetical protein